MKQCLLNKYSMFLFNAHYSVFSIYCTWCLGSSSAIFLLVLLCSNILLLNVIILWFIQSELMILNNQYSIQCPTYIYIYIYIYVCNIAFRSSLLLLKFVTGNVRLRYTLFISFCEPWTCGFSAKDIQVPTVQMVAN